jgi:hypothetical protein
LATSAELRAVLDRPALATLTILCERPQRKAEQAPPHSEYDWVPSCLGGELFLSPGESSRLILQPQFPIRNLRWFVSGDPAIVLEGLVIGNQHTSACRGGTKYGDWQGTVAPGCNITAELRRCAP